MAELLKVDGLNLWMRTASGVSRILQDTSLTVSEGEIHGLIGESGCGKTMLTRTVLDLLDTERAVISGSIKYKGSELTSLPKHERRRLSGKEIGYITQDPLTALNPLYRVGEQIAEMLRYHMGMPRKEALQEAAGLLERVGIRQGKEARRKYPHEFSGGQLQRICLAMAVSCKPGLIIADEPTTALDVTTQARILELFRELRRSGTAVLIVTHDYGVAAEICDSISVMEKGRIIEHGSMQALLENPQQEYTRRLIESAVRKESAYEQ